MERLSKQQVRMIAQQVRSQGYSRVPSVLDPAVVSSIVEVARETIDVARRTETTDGSKGLYLRNIMDAKGTAQPASDGRASYHIEHVFRYVRQFRKLMTNVGLVALVKATLDDTPVVLDDQLYWKPPHSGGETYLHRDSDFFGSLRVITVWIPLTPVCEQSGCLWFVPGSNVKSDESVGVRRRTSAPNGNPDSERRFDYFYEIDHNKLELVPVPAEQGDVIVLDSTVLHGSYSVTGNCERLSYLIEYCSRDAWCRNQTSLEGLFCYHDRLSHMFACEL